MAVVTMAAATAAVFDLEIIFLLQRAVLTL